MNWSGMQYRSGKVYSEKSRSEDPRSEKTRGAKKIIGLVPTKEIGSEYSNLDAGYCLDLNKHLHIVYIFLLGIYFVF